MNNTSSTIALLVSALFSLGACSEPAGVKCSEHPECIVDVPCDEGLSCMEFNGCESPICISDDQACDETCRGKCSIDDSYPSQVSCKNKTPASP